ncbi:uncharacterized protein EI97DRAFT_462681 [Westerdykella ornata]|uniref:Uncharacterized protein n=1 Tax=Westerdykella ornata TaxID=318751 RepID=A0A6A6J5Y6_WESOR|nr:uncharacterized protein EI97DRAFT_462681 [Westerdykella ornata]KAF2271634.1 hypothetical protein EI97DRAFT_462681 [Westerdykella ornata]
MSTILKGKKPKTDASIVSTEPRKQLTAHPTPKQDRRAILEELKNAIWEIKWETKEADLEVVRIQERLNKIGEMTAKVERDKKETKPELGKTQDKFYKIAEIGAKVEHEKREVKFEVARIQHRFSRIGEMATKAEREIMRIVEQDQVDA